MKIKTLHIAVAMFITIASIQAQPGFTWQKSLGDNGSGINKCEATTVDAQGNVYVVGRFENTVDFNTGTGTYNLTSKGLSDGYVAKYASNGNFVWARAFGGGSFDFAKSVEVDAAGNVIVGGVVNSGGYAATTDDDTIQYYQNNSNLANVVTKGQVDAVFAKYNSSGTLLFNKIFGGLKTDMLGDLDIDQNGNIYITGYFYEKTDLDPGPDSTIYTSFNGWMGPASDIFLSKFDAQGNFIFGKRLGGLETDYGLEIDVNNIGDVFFTGIFARACDFNWTSSFDTLQTQSDGTSDQNAFVCKYDTAGNYVWARQISGSGSQFGNGISSNNTGEVYVSGTYGGTTSIGGGTSSAISINNSGINDAFVCKFSAIGNTLWAKKVGGATSDVCNGLAIDNANNAYITGAFYSFNLNFGNNGVGPVIVHPVSVATSNQDLYMAKYNSTGALQWAYGFGNATGNEEGLALAIAPNDNAIILAGYSNGDTIDFDPTTLVNSFNGSGNYNGFLVKYSACSISRSIVKDSLVLTAEPGYLAYQWIDCVTNQPILGATSNVYNPTQNGNYACIITGSEGCIDTTTCYDITAIITCNINNSITQKTDSLKVGEPNATYQWVVCPTYANVVGATNQSYKVTLNASYACIITLANGCKDTTACYSIQDVGFEDVYSNMNFTIAPNPTKNALNLMGIDFTSNMAVTIITIEGKEIVANYNPTKNGITINVNELANGLYSLKILNKKNGDTVIKKFIKQN